MFILLSPFSICREGDFFENGVLVGATSQHSAGSLGREQFFRELYILCLSEPYNCMSHPCVFALVMNGKASLQEYVLRDTINRYYEKI